MTRATAKKSFIVCGECFSLARHRVYTHEEPNSLTPAEAAMWLSAFKDKFPRFYAMTFLGLVLGQRPSTLRPLRRRGPTPDLDLANRVLLVRRSHTVANEVMDSTKTAKDQNIKLPPPSSTYCGGTSRRS
jgi:hypothetical protein